MGNQTMQQSLKQKMDKLWEECVSEVTAAKQSGQIDPPEQTSSVGLAKWFTKQIEEITTCIDEAEAAVGMRCVCGKGCDACCKQAIQVLPTEAKAISAYMSRFTIEQKQYVQKRIEEWMEKAKASGLDMDQNKYYRAGNAEEAIYQFMERYFALGLPCPMLSEDGECMIYPVRPGGCWSYRVYSDKEACKHQYEVLGGMKHDEWERYLLDVLFSKVKGDTKMKLLPFYIEDILNHRL